MKPIRLGIVGPGLIWDNAHRDVVLSMPDAFRIVAFSARSEGTLSKAHSQVPTAALFLDYRELLASEDVEAVMLLTPIPLNGRLTIEALEAGKMVFVEKPLATSLREGRRIRHEEQTSGLPVYVLEQAPYAPLWSRVAESIAAGRIGEPVTYEKVKHVYLDPIEDQTPGYGKTDWRIRTTFPIGNLFDGGIHDLAVHAKLFGQPRRLRAWGQSLRDGFGEYDHVSIAFEYESGLLGYFSHSAYLGGRRNYFTIRGSDGLIHVADHEAVIEPKRGHIEHLPPDQTSSHAHMWRLLATAAQNGDVAPYSTSDALREIGVLERIADSLHGEKEIGL
jgi:myo-inositol 2-dehydrogenase/D-chiro-inositol 1-dehydrogenase